MSEDGRRAFLIRPFGIKDGVDFDVVEKELLGPALEQLGIGGRTTIDILRAGSIRVDMFQRLLTADLVIADVSIHNANVFFELGIRHALREKRTFLVRATGDAYPFDLQTDRYFTYDRVVPQRSLPDLVRALAQTLASDETDSPVFRSLPALKAQDPGRFMVIPPAFREEVERAEKARRSGDLALLRDDVRRLEWEIAGLRVIGNAQFRLKALEEARETWVAVRRLDPNDLEANTLLGTIYQKLGDLTASDQALRRVLDRSDLADADRAEALALRARNAKARWVAAWQDASPAVPAVPAAIRALRSPHLETAQRLYSEAFHFHLNAFFPGINTLALIRIWIDLARREKDVWEEGFERPAQAEDRLASLEAEAARLSAVVETSLAAAEARPNAPPDVWREITKADLTCLTSSKPSRVAGAYRSALAQPTVSAFHVQAARDQLLIFKALGVLPENVDAAIAVTDELSVTAATITAPPKSPERVLVFTGHRVDEEGRAVRRFPVTQEPAARDAIRAAVRAEMPAMGKVQGFAGGASGGDILFHEVCAELGIPTELYLALPRDLYVKRSVASAGPAWIERFDRVLAARQDAHRVLSDSEDLPPWLADKPDYGIWQRNNLWTLDNALACAGAAHLTLIALWDGKAQGDGPGGTSDLVARARDRGARVVVLDTRALFGLG